MDKIEVKGINLKVGKKELNLSVEEAKELKRVLNELFEREVVKEIIHHHTPQWWWSVPNWTVTSSVGISVDSKDLTSSGITFTNKCASIDTEGMLYLNV